jgi:hypothetical protein
MSHFTDQFMSRVLAIATRAADERVEGAREVQMAVLAANILTELASSELFFEDDDREQMGIAAMRLIVHLHLQVQ